MKRAASISGIWLLVAIAGFIVWSSAFVFLYGTQGLGCALRWDGQPLLGTNILTALLTALWLIHLVLIGVLLWFSLARWRPRYAERGSPDMFLAALACLVVASSGIATIYIGFPVLFLPPCG